MTAASGQWSLQHGHTPEGTSSQAGLARVVGYAQKKPGVEPKYLFAAPALPYPNVERKVGWTLKDVD